MKHNTDDVLKAVATKHGVSEEEVIQSIREAIDVSWNDSENAEIQQRLFPCGKPELETFLQTLKEGALDNRTKLLMARDAILSYLMHLDLWKDEAETVLQMCLDEMRAWETRQTFSEVPKKGEEANESKNRIQRLYRGAGQSEPSCVGDVSGRKDGASCTDDRTDDRRRPQGDGR